MRRFLTGLLGLAGLLALTACAGTPTTEPADTRALAAEIAALGPDVDPAEAARAAEIASSYALQLAADWQVTDPPLVHNAKVLHGLRDKGLCNDWAEAMITRLRQERFETLEMHWATSPPEGFRVIHHSAVISARGAELDDGVLLDPWRGGGTLFWAPPPEDTRYDWYPRMEVRAAREAAHASR